MINRTAAIGSSEARASGMTIRTISRTSFSRHRTFTPPPPESPSLPSTQLELYGYCSGLWLRVIRDSWQLGFSSIGRLQWGECISIQLKQLPQLLLLYMCEIYTQRKVAEATSPQMRCVGRNDSTITWKSIFHKFSVQNPPVNDSRDMRANTSPFPSITMLLQHTNGHKRKKTSHFRPSLLESN